MRREVHNQIKHLEIAQCPFANLPVKRAAHGGDLSPVFRTEPSTIFVFRERSMSKSKHREAQMAAALRQVEALRRVGPRKMEDVVNHEKVERAYREPGLGVKRTRRKSLRRTLRQVNLLRKLIGAPV